MNYEAGFWIMLLATITLAFLIVLIMMRSASNSKLLWEEIDQKANTITILEETRVEMLKKNLDLSCENEKIKNDNSSLQSKYVSSLQSKFFLIEENKQLGELVDVLLEEVYIQEDNV